MQQFVKEGHLRWDSLGEYLALAVSLEGHAEKTGDATAKMLAEALNEATGQLLDNNKSPSRKGKELDNRGSTFYIAKYWAEAMAKRDPAFASLASELSGKEEQIVKELIECQGPPVDLGGLKPDFAVHAGERFRPPSTRPRDSVSTRKTATRLVITPPGARVIRAPPSPTRFDLLHAAPHGSQS